MLCDNCMSKLSLAASFYRLLGCLFSRNIEKGALLHLVCCFNVYCTRNVRVRQHTQHCINNLLHLFVRQPLLLPQHLLTNQPLLYVWVVNWRTELDQRKFEWELFWKVNIDDELVAFIGTSNRAVHKEFPVKEVFLNSRHDSSG